MALSIKTEEADRLAREVASLTGESMTEAVTTALRERLARLHKRRGEKGSTGERLMAIAEEFQDEYDTRPVTKEEWEAALGEDE